jgi:hypothetical protein
LIALFSFTAGFAQQVTPPSFYRAEFLKAKPGKLLEYRTFLKENMPVIARSQIKSGNLMTWGLSQVVTPTGASEEHDLIGLYGYSKWANIEPKDDPPDYIKAAMKELGFASPQDYMVKRDPLRDIVRSEIWRRVAGTTPTAENIPKAGDYIIVTYVKNEPGKGRDYEEAWKKYSLPIQEDLVKAGKLKSYTMFGVLSGAGGTDEKYDRITFARYASFNDIMPESGPGGGETDAVAEKIHSGKDWRQMRRDMQALRTPYRSEIVKIVDTVR